jgi:pimeloyl-ACP methyl ester carboxylesterase
MTALGLLSSPAPLPDDQPDDVLGSESGVFADGEIEAARTLSWADFLAWYKEHNGAEPPDVEQFLANAANSLPAFDKQVLELPQVRAFLRITLTEAFRQGMVGWAWDSRTLARPWGFSVQAIRVPTYLWHGLEDTVVPVKHGRALAQSIPNCAATYYPDTGHFVPPYRWNEILTTMVTVPDRFH